MAAYDRLHNVQTQSPAVPVLGAGFVQLVEPVEYQRQLVRRDGLAVVGDGDVSLAAALFDAQPQIAPVGAELYGVVDEIVDDLGDVVRIRHGVHRMLRHIHVDVQVLVIDLLLEGDEHLPGAFLKVEVHLLFLGDAALFLQLGDVQHTAHETA